MIINPYIFASAVANVTYNPSDKSSLITLSAGNLTATKNATTGHVMVRATQGMTTGKWYWEVKPVASNINSIAIGGIATSAANLNSYPGSDVYGYVFNGVNGNGYHNGASIPLGSSSTSGVIGVAFDATAGNIWWYVNGTWRGTGAGANPATGASPAYSGIATGPWFPSTGLYDASSVVSAFFKASSLTYSPPAGFTALGGP